MEGSKDVDSTCKTQKFDKMSKEMMASEETGYMKRYKGARKFSPAAAVGKRDRIAT